MAKTSMINARIEPKLKKEVERILERLGLNTTQAVTLFFRHVKNFRGLPFEVKLPNSTTEQAIDEARTGVKLKRFNSVKELAEELER